MANNPFMILIMQRAKRGLLLFMLLLSLRGPETLRASTFSDSSWFGRYTWVNPTVKTNQGKIERYSLMITEATSNLSCPFEIHLPSGSETLRLFPLLEAEERSDEWVEWESSERWAQAYRENATIFNTTGITPTAWRLKEQCFVDNCIFTSIITRVMLMHFTCDSTIEMLILPGGEKALLLSLTGRGLASWGLFKNPKPGPFESATSFLLHQEK